MSPSTITETRPSGHQVGERVELARYTISAGERVIYGQRVDGIVRVTDRPASGPGRSYLVERELEQDGNSALKARSRTISLRRARTTRCRCCYRQPSGWVDLKPG